MTTSTSTTLNAAQQVSLAKAEKMNSCCETYKTDIVKVQRFSDAATILAAVVPKINIAERIKNTNQDTKSITEEKNQLLKALILKSDGLGVVLRSSDDFKDAESEAQLQKMFKTKLRKFSQELAVDTMMSFFTFLAKQDAKVLAKDAITFEEIAQMQTECASIRDFSKKKGAAVQQKIDNQASLVTLFEELDAAMTLMINLSSRFISIAPVFYAAFNKIVTFKTKEMLQKAEKIKASRLKNKKKSLSGNDSDKTETEKPT
jgi:hypothetical protein